MPKTTSTEATEDTKTIVTVLLLIFLYPIGVIVMWFYPKWKTWVKIVISLPIIIFLLSITLFFLGTVFFLVSPPDKTKQLNETQMEMRYSEKSQNLQSSPALE